MKIETKIVLVGTEKYFDHDKDYLSARGTWKSKNKEKDHEPFPNSVDIFCWKEDMECRVVDTYVMSYNIQEKFIKTTCETYLIKKWTDTSILAINTSPWCVDDILYINPLIEKVDLISKPKKNKGKICSSSNTNTFFYLGSSDKIDE